MDRRRECRRCGETFDPERMNEAYCSRRCWSLSIRVYDSVKRNGALGESIYWLNQYTKAMRAKLKEVQNG